MPDLTTLPTLVASTIALATSASPETSPESSEPARGAVAAASMAFIEAFNRGDAEGCAHCYSVDATMEARPLADLRGRDAIRSFWQEVLDGDPGTLRYLDPYIHMLDERVAVLSSRWSMSRLGSGIITLERWEQQAGGNWRLVEDRFEIREQNSASKP